MGRRVRFQLDLDADSLQSVEDKLLDIATDIARGQFSASTVFGSPSTKGYYTLTDASTDDTPDAPAQVTDAGSQPLCTCKPDGECEDLAYGPERCRFDVPDTGRPTEEAQ